MRSLAALYQLRKIFGPKGAASQNRTRAAAAFREYIDANQQAESALRTRTQNVGRRTATV